MTSGLRSTGCLHGCLDQGAPCVFSREREPEYDGYDSFTCSVRGVRGAYFLQAITRDDLGPYTSKREAIAVLRSEYLT